METRDKIIIGVAVILGALILLAPFADPNPDGLESAAEQYSAPEGSGFDLGFLTDYGSEDSLIYKIVSNSFLTTIISGVVGILVVMGVFIIPLYFIRRKKAEAQNINA